VKGERIPNEALIMAYDKNVVVIGGGDTGSDCVGTSIRQGAKSVSQFEILPRPPEASNPETPWPLWPRILRTSSSQEEGCQRRWGVLTKHLEVSDGKARSLHGCEVEWTNAGGRWQMQEVPGSEFSVPADLVLLAMGFVHVVHSGIVEQLGLKIDPRGNLWQHRYMTSVEGIFAAGDSMMGASLVVHAINHGRQAAAAIDKWLQGR